MEIEQTRTCTRWNCNWTQFVNQITDFIVLRSCLLCLQLFRIGFGGEKPHRTFRAIGFSPKHIAYICVIYMLNIKYIYRMSTVHGTLRKYSCIFGGQMKHEKRNIQRTLYKTLKTQFIDFKFDYHILTDIQWNIVIHCQYSQNECNWRVQCF